MYVEESQRRASAHRGLWLAIITLAALVLGLIVGIVVSATGAGLLAALSAGGCTVSGAMALGITAWLFIHNS
jgi:hypothetical protein